MEVYSAVEAALVDTGAVVVADLELELALADVFFSSSLVVNLLPIAFAPKIVWNILS